MIQVKRRPVYTRAEYLQLERHSIVIASWSTNPTNCGGIIRSAEAFLVQDVLLSYSPTRATSVGSENWQPWSTFSPISMIKQITEYWLRDYTIVALEQTDRSQLLYEAKLPEKIVFLVGNESSGIPKEALDMASMAVEIPLYGFTSCLNVASATTVALYEWCKQWQKSLSKS